MLTNDKTEELIRACLLRGTSCDPQTVADAIREWCESYRAQTDAQPTADNAKYWHDRYREMCLKRQDDVARLGARIEELEEAAQQQTKPRADETSDPTGLIARLRVHGEDRANTAFARSTMREAAGVLEDQKRAGPVGHEAWPKVLGVGRDNEHSRNLVVYLGAAPTDGELRAIHDALHAAQSGQRAGVAEEVGVLKLNPLTPYGMLVRALRIVANATLAEMAAYVGKSAAHLSAMEFGRKEVSTRDYLDAGLFFHSKGITHTDPALDTARTARTEFAAPTQQQEVRVSAAQTQAKTSQEGAM